MKMNKFQFYCTLILMSTFVTANLWCKESSSSGGFVGGGGGSGVNREGNLFLLDLVEFDSSHIDHNNLYQHQKLILDTVEDDFTKSLTVPIFTEAGTLENEIQISISSERVQEEFKKRLLGSEPAKYAMEYVNDHGVALMLPLAIFHSLNWFFTLESPAQQHRFQTSEKINKNIETIAYYFYKKDSNNRNSGQVILSIPRWNRMDFYDQVALIIHESLRHFQIGITSQNRGLEFNEEVLQKTTALITFCRPTSYIEQYLLRFLSSYNGRFGGEEGLGIGFSYQEAIKRCERRKL